MLTKTTMWLLLFASSITASTSRRYVVHPVVHKTSADLAHDVAKQTYDMQARPPVLLVVLDTLRADYVTFELMPHLQQFVATHNSARRTLAAATATDHSLFSVMHVRPAYEREQAFALWPQPKSLALGLLQRAGYSVNLFAYPQWYACPLRVLPKHVATSPWTDVATFELLYGHEGHLLTRCPNRDADAVDANNLVDADRTLVRQYLQAVAARQTDPLAPAAFDILHLYGAHDPYGIDTQIEGLHTPYFDGGDGRRLMGSRQRLHTASKRQELINTYTNAVMSLDGTIGMLLSGLQAHKAFDDRIIVIFSDHGEGLPQDAIQMSGHGMDPTYDQANVIAAYKLLSPKRLHRMHDTASITSIFPTLLDDLGLLAQTDPHLVHQFTAPSILSTSHSAAPCFSIVRPNQALPPVRLALSNGTQKLFVTITKRNAAGEPIEVEADALCDMDDMPIRIDDAFLKQQMIQALVQCLEVP